jgi:hypothetical protein
MDDPLQNVCFVFVLKMATTVGQRLNMGKRKKIFRIKHHKPTTTNEQKR